MGAVRSTPKTVPMYTRLCEADAKYLRRTAKRNGVTPSHAIKQIVEAELTRERKREQARKAAA